MYRKAIVLKIEDGYVLAMEEGGGIIRIKQKDGLTVGDSIYVLPEDLYQKEEASVIVPLSGANGRKKPSKRCFSQKSIWMRVAGMAAVLFLCISLLIPHVLVTAYAQASFDGQASVQVKLDQSYKIISAVSPDNSVSTDALHSLRGKLISEVGAELRALCGSGSVLVGYAFWNDADADSGLQQKLQALFRGQPIVCVSGSAADIQAADGKTRSLGTYLMEKQMTDNDVDDLLEGLALNDLEQMLRENPNWMNDSDFREALEEKKEKLAEAESDEMDEIEDVDDEEEVEDTSEPTSVAVSDEIEDADNDSDSDDRVDSSSGAKDHASELDEDDERDEADDNDTDDE